MTLPIRIKRACQADLLETFTWYEEQEAGLGVAFLEETDAVVSRIQDHPQAFPVTRSDIRRAVLKRFPYCLYYVVDSDSIAILACLHAKRSPRVLRHRIDTE